MSDNNNNIYSTPHRMFRPIPNTPPRISGVSRMATHRVLMRTFDEAIDAAKHAADIDNAFSQEGLVVEEQLNRSLYKLDTLKKIYANLAE